MAPSLPRAAVVPAAGLGTRLLPATLAVDKELLPLGRHPALYAVLLEALGAGLDTLAIVLSPGKDGIRRFLDPETWPRSFRRPGEHTALDPLRAMLRQLHIHFVTQPEPVGALDAIERGLLHAGLPCPVLYPDLIQVPDQRALGTLLSAHTACQETTFGLYVAGPGSALHGPSARVVLDTKEAPPHLPLLIGHPLRILRVEAGAGAPQPGEVRTTFGYVHTTPFREALEQVARPSPTAPLSDRHLLDAMNLLCTAGRLYGTLLPGEVLDLGTPPGYLAAARRFADGESRFRDLDDHESVGSRQG